MEQVKIYHEAPLSIFEKVQEVTDGDYALVHLLPDNDGYASKFNGRKRDSGRPIILDNSAFELGKSFDAGEFAAWVDFLDPDIYVVPDTIGDMEETVASFKQFTEKYHYLKGQKMGVLQATSTTQGIRCFNELVEAGADIIGIPFMLGKDWSGVPTPFELSLYRTQMIDLIEKNCSDTPIHLLGVGLPQEGLCYKEKPQVVSVDTSNPVIHGYHLVNYTDRGLTFKIPTLLADLIDVELTRQQELVILNNISKFKEFWRR